VRDRSVGHFRTEGFGGGVITVLVDSEGRVRPQDEMFPSCRRITRDVVPGLPNDLEQQSNDSTRYRGKLGKMRKIEFRCSKLASERATEFDSFVPSTFQG
jgi:hypothetical protein